MNIHSDKQKRLWKILKIIALVLMGVILAFALYLESQSPATLWINDTDTEVHQYLIGGTSPGVRLNVASGEHQFVDMPSWWGEPQLPRLSTGKKVQPTYNFIIFKVFYLSAFPEDWRK